jgi:hypothetical protein
LELDSRQQAALTETSSVLTGRATRDLGWADELNAALTRTAGAIGWPPKAGTRWAAPPFGPNVR